ncbi:hypothetical protein [Methylomicrobium lacus]|uniref:hypothetical protein n=1 Tax=Methylomicrobium lacus TaxID=136992 RepID=UPI00045E9BD0|nr:hypothetical protein [Methylomicrobium lacus]
MNTYKDSLSSRLVLCFIVLVGLIILHVIPLPILETLVLYVLITRPYWFKDLVDQIYRSKKPSESADE